jgi:SpoVK/Ycf46/Vps4 family AAA+-type ATPase
VCRYTLLIQATNKNIFSALSSYERPTCYVYGMNITKLFRTNSENGITAKETGIFDHFEKIIEISKKYGIDKCLSRGKSHFDYVTGKLHITPLQAVLFSHFMEKSNDDHILIREIADSINCSTIRMIKYTNECEELEKKKLIRCSRSDDSISFRVPHEVRESLRKYNEYKPENNDNLDIAKFFTVLERLFDERGKDELSFEALRLELLDLINMNMHLEFCKKIMSYSLYDEVTFVLLIFFCHSSSNDDDVSINDIASITPNSHILKITKSELSDGTHTLIEEKLVEFSNNNGFINSESWKLSEMAKKELLSELGTKGKGKYIRNIIRFNDIKPRKMFYNERETGAIQTLISLLSDENFRKIQNRLDNKGMRKGFACLFSGGPGTGKTETAWQIARETNRNIMMVDISETKSCWFGESEKRIKEIFDTYRISVEKSEIAPILLLNEADAVIGKRKEFNSSSRAVDQTENTIQNIILQEMENLSGILIATTNLTQNMDSAFERRFLYKIVFDKPGVESRRGIWNAMLPDLQDGKASELAGLFELTGGQIENITRKIEVDGILNGNALSADTLAQYCRDEIQNGFSTAKRIGFTNE